MDMLKATEETIRIGQDYIGLDELVNYKIVAKILGLSSRTVRDLGTGSRRVLPVYQVGSCSNRFLVRDLVERCEGRRVFPA